MTATGVEHVSRGEIRDREAALRLFAPIALLHKEVAMFAYLDPDWRILGVRYSPSNMVHSATVPVRDIARDALALDARRVLMAHNHPGGDPRPSRDDITATRRLATTLRAIGVVLVDHLVLAGAKNQSLRAAGLL